VIFFIGGIPWSCNIIVQYNGERNIYC
jgi:hypothetical protein